ncbi:SDR family NAD(P)-dependent oxidoreductase [Streptomyces sp. NPDC059740]|uniref:SDR family NAD(P)-dependent oxidoreductase n=1 Tax=Streptomyces sp. NPDC059740 TaxID=3346926 RepID=UPI003661513A
MPDLGRQDTVLVTGGGRGIGFAIAEELARRTGCRVVVTGRAAPPGDEPWQALDEKAFARWSREELRAAAGKDAVRDTRRRLSRAAQQREVHGNLRRAAAAGLRLEYQRCDCTDPEAVRDLLERIGEPPTVLIHNAGTDQSRRFADQSPHEVADTVAVKVDGLLTVVDAVRTRPGARLRLVSGVGSLAGRVGGMVGQVAYSAGNDALARLGHWISAELGIPAQTTVWHTWAGRSGLANLRTAVRYTSLVDPGEGVDHWAREILSGAAGEVLFMGRYGNAVLPHQLSNRMPLVYDADHPRWASARHYLGELRSYRIHGDIECVNRLRTGDHPCFGEYTVDGHPALPVSVLLEYAISLGDWVTPHGWPPLRLREVTGVDVRLGSLAFRDGELRLRKRGHGAERRDGSWTVTVDLARDDDGTPVLSADLVYGEEPAEVPPPRARSGPPRQPAAAATGSSRHRWSRHLFRAPVRRAAAGGGEEFALRPVEGADLWSLPYAPATRIDPAALETLARTAITARGDSAERLRIARLVPGPGATRLPVLRSSADGADWLGTTGEGTPALLAEGVAAGPLT